jgi:hypothetical protein
MLVISKNGKVLTVHTDDVDVTNFTEAIPEPLVIPGKEPILCIDTVSGDLFYEYKDLPLSPTEKKLEEEIALLWYQIMLTEGGV